MQCGVDIAWHGDVDSAVDIVPCQSHAAVERFRPAEGNVVQGFDGVDKMVGVLNANVLDPKVVDDKGESDGTCGMSPEGWGALGGSVAVCGKVFLEALVRNLAGLFEAGHSFADFHINPAIGSGDGMELVFLDNFVGELEKVHLHVLKTGHGRPVIEIFMSKVLKRAFGVEMVLLSSILVVVKLAV